MRVHHLIVYINDIKKYKTSKIQIKTFGNQEFRNVY